MNLLPQTELEAVNICLQNINESPVNSLSTSQGDALIAIQMLHDNSRRIQSIGLLCNTDYKMELTRDVNNHINLPKNTLKVYIPDSYNDNKRDAVQRGMKLYDRQNNTYVFDDSYEVDIVSF